MFSPVNKKNTKKGFTLIEILVVIVILGILIAALVPRLSSARGRANDVARKADLAQVGVALVAYQIDHAKFPTDPAYYGDLKNMSGLLLGVGLNGIPTDPMASRTFNYGISGYTMADGQYGYMPVIKGGINYNGFVLMAKSETEGGSNRVADAGTGLISTGNSAEEIASRLCKNFFSTTGNAINGGSGVCRYNKNTDQLRYIYIY